MTPHHRVHRWREQDRPAGGKQDGGGEIVGVSVGHLGHQVGGRRCDHDEIVVTRKPDVTDVELEHDFFVPSVRQDSKGVRVFVTATVD